LLADKLELRKNGINFSKTADIYDMPLKAADIIDQIIKEKWLKKNWKDKVE
jgi:hypothetical protein